MLIPHPHTQTQTQQPHRQFVHTYASSISILSIIYIWCVSFIEFMLMKFCREHSMVLILLYWNCDGIFFLAGAKNSVNIENPYAHFQPTNYLKLLYFIASLHPNEERKLIYLTTINIKSKFVVYYSHIDAKWVNFLTKSIISTINSQKKESSMISARWLFGIEVNTLSGIYFHLINDWLCVGVHLRLSALTILFIRFISFRRSSFPLKSNQ